MPSYYPKDSLVDDRQLKVQRLVIPFFITANASTASVVVSTDEPSILFLRTQGNNQITTASGALDSGETATYTTGPTDSTGVFNMLVKVTGEPVLKVCEAYLWDRVNGTYQLVQLGSATGLSSLGKIMLTGDSTSNFSTTNFDASLCVSYIVGE